MKNYFYCSMLQRPEGFVYSNGVISMESPDIGKLREIVVAGLAEDGVKAETKQIIVLAFNQL